MILENIKGFFENYRLSSTPFLHELLIPEQIVLEVGCSNYSEAIAAAGQILLDGGFIDRCYIEAMVENIEKNGPYIVVSEGFAVPHAGFDAGSKAVGMSLIRLENPVILIQRQVLPYGCTMYAACPPLTINSILRHFSIW